jgi:adenylate cyclase class 2
LPQELEVKFYIADLASLEMRLAGSGGQLVQEKVYENNLRFDTPDSALTRNGCALRLRQDTEARLTYKGPSQSDAGVRVRQEIEFTVGNFEAARQFVEALGYQISFVYEKYRTSYALQGVHVVLDELPYGHFVEIEGPDPASIHAVTTLLGLDWERRVPESYSTLFDLLKEELDLKFRDLSFANFRNYHKDMRVLGIYPADR